MRKFQAGGLKLNGLRQSTLPGSSAISLATQPGDMTHIVKHKHAFIIGKTHDEADQPQHSSTTYSNIIIIMTDLDAPSKWGIIVMENFGAALYDGHPGRHKRQQCMTRGF
eukprot:scaffold37357_cov14-Prasinocladus_malaysianus.AAC.1